MCDGVIAVAASRFVTSMAIGFVNVPFAGLNGSGCLASTTVYVGWRYYGRFGSWAITKRRYIIIDTMHGITRPSVISHYSLIPAPGAGYR